MQPASSQLPTPSLPDLDEVRTLICGSLCPDWVVRIEHRPSGADADGLWRSWGRPGFARRDPDPLLDDIHACHTTHPKHEIRLCAERWRPESRLLYSIFQPVPGHTPPPALLERSSRWSRPQPVPVRRPLAARIGGARRALMGTIGLVGSLLGSALIIEMAIN